MKRLVGEGIRRFARPEHVRIKSVFDLTSSARGGREERAQSSDAQCYPIPRAASRLRLRRCRQLCQRCQTRRSVLGSLGMLRREGRRSSASCDIRQCASLSITKARPRQHLPVIHCRAAHDLKWDRKQGPEDAGRSSTMRIAGMALQAQAGGQASSEEEQAGSLLLQRCMLRHCGRALRPICFGSSARSDPGALFELARNGRQCLSCDAAYGTSMTRRKHHLSDQAFERLLE